MTNLPAQDTDLENLEIDAHKVFRILTAAKREKDPRRGPLLSLEIRRRPTLPGSLLPSTIGAGGLNFRVRNGNGCDPAAIATETFVKRVRQNRPKVGPVAAPSELHSEHEHLCRSKPSAD